VICSCTERDKERMQIRSTQETAFEYRLADVERITIDSCEYIWCWYGYVNGGATMIHPADCKYCIARATGEEVPYDENEIILTIEELQDNCRKLNN